MHGLNMAFKVAGYPLSLLALPFRAARINASTVPAAVLQMKPEPRSGLSLARLDGPSLDSLNGVNVPRPAPSILSQIRALARSVSNSPPRTNAGRIDIQNPLPGQQDFRVSSFTESLLPLRPHGPPDRRTIQIHSRGLPSAIRPISVRSPAVFIV